MFPTPPPGPAPVSVDNNVRFAFISDALGRPGGRVKVATKFRRTQYSEKTHTYCEKYREFFLTLLAAASWSVSGLRAAAGARRHRGHGGEGGGGGVARRVLQLRGLRRRARRPPLLLLLRHGPDLLRQASVWFCNVGIDVKRCCTVHAFRRRPLSTFTHKNLLRL